MTGALVELCGLPGSGKSTLAAALVEELAARGIPARILDTSVSAAVVRHRRVATRLRAAASTFARHPAAALAAAGVVAGTRQSRVRDAAAVLLQWLAVVQLAGQRPPACTGVLEEGVVQTLWTLGLRGRRERTWQAWRVTPASARPDLVVVVEAPVHVILDRLATRVSRHSRTQALPAAGQLAELVSGEQAMEDILTLTGLRTVRVTNDGRCALATLAAAVADDIGDAGPKRSLPPIAPRPQPRPGRRMT